MSELSIGIKIVKIAVNRMSITVKIKIAASARILAILPEYLFPFHRNKNENKKIKKSMM